MVCISGMEAAGGGIYNTNELKMVNCVVRNNLSGEGGE